ncbi:MAG TPA: DNA-binding protein [Alphaproteobacteria bacterium]|nr:DNA-binding protein [Alphaproteobacteria bacterium]
MTDILFTADALSARWGIATQTLSQWRWNSKGPKYLKMGKRILYPLKEVEAFETKMLRLNTTEVKAY